MSPFRFKAAAGIQAMALAVAGGPASAQVVHPAAATLVAGQSCTFQVRMPAGPGIDGWSWTILDGGAGTLDESEGTYRAPPVAAACRVKIRATSRPDPGFTADASILVVPHQPFGIVGDVLGADWVAPFSSELPFWNPATGRRWGDGTERVETTAGAAADHLAGYGLPFTLRWRPHPSAQAQLLTWGEGETLVQEDVSGQCSQLLTVTGRRCPFTVEALGRGQSGAWRSHRQTAAINVRGMAPWVGNAVAAPGHADGAGVSARFLEPFGLATVPETHPLRAPRSGCLVSDPRSHVIRLVSSDGQVSTPWGRPGEAGHRDVSLPSPLRRLLTGQSRRASVTAPGTAARFNRPTFLCVSPGQGTDAGGNWRGLVADSGNHVIRAIHPDGTVTTLAGVPGQAGHRDCRARWEVLTRPALFNDPQGLAFGRCGVLFVADRGNRVIRWIMPDGQVGTLAGAPGVSGSQDGPAAVARFTDLRGLAFIDTGAESALFAVDGHAIRRISPPHGEVTTVLGVVDTPGFLDVMGGSEEERSRALRQPCFNRPCGILARHNGTGLHIADLGNHAVRTWSIGGVALGTMVGDPGLAEVRWGLVRDGMEVPLDERYAGLEEPRTLTAGGPDPATFWVAAGRCLAEIGIYQGLRDSLFPVLLECPAVRMAETFAVRFLVEAVDREGRPSPRPLHYTVDFIEADGSLADRVRGTGACGSFMSVQGRLLQPGAGAVVVRCVSDQGISVGARRQVQVPP